MHNSKMQKNHNNDVSYWKFYVLDKMFSIWIVWTIYVVENSTWTLKHLKLDIGIAQLFRK